MDLEQGLDGAVRLFEVAGVGILILGGIVSVVAYARDLASGVQRQAAYTALRHNLGRTILLGLEVLIVADIILTVAIDQTLESAATLGLIVLVRTFLSFSLDIEMDGVVPWRRRATERLMEPRPGTDRSRPMRPRSPGREGARTETGPGSGSPCRPTGGRGQLPLGVDRLGLGGGFLDRPGRRLVDGDRLDLLGVGHLGLDSRARPRRSTRARIPDVPGVMTPASSSSTSSRCDEVARLAGGGTGRAERDRAGEQGRGQEHGSDDATDDPPLEPGPRAVVGHLLDVDPAVVVGLDDEDAVDVERRRRSRPSSRPS